MTLRSNLTAVGQSVSSQRPVVLLELILLARIMDRIIRAAELTKALLMLKP
jgi:hypothetical protein